MTVIVDGEIRDAFGDCVQNQFDEDGFRQYLSNLNYAGERQVLRYARKCLELGAETPEDVNDVFRDLAAGTRSKYRNALSRYRDYLATVRRAEVME